MQNKKKENFNRNFPFNINLTKLLFLNHKLFMGYTYKYYNN